jgi:SAM-dependent methyltransferase
MSLAKVLPMVLSRLPERMKRPLRPLLHGARAAAFHAAPLTGGRKRYGIAAGYRHRKSATECDPHDIGEEWQREVYVAARSLMRERGLRTVCDVGCGSGFKLAEILGEFETVGLDLPQTIEKVRKRYPDRTWISGSFDELHGSKFDLVICADVVEHVADPVALMHMLVATASQAVVVSTPDRDRLYSRGDSWRFGPPRNPSHLREWTMAEFRAFVDPYLSVERHEITNAEHGTQMVIGRPRRA